MICIRPTFGGKGSFDLHWCPVKINGWMTIKKKSSVIVCTACKIAGGMRIGQDLRALVKKSNIYIYIYIYIIYVLGVLQQLMSTTDLNSRSQLIIATNHILTTDLSR